MKKIKIQLVQLNRAYGNQYYIPYSIGSIVAYAQKFKRIIKNFEFKSFIYKRDSVKIIVKQIGKIDILGLSCYMWNWEICLLIAKEVKKHNPNCIIIIGGPNVPKNTNTLFTKYPFLDIACHGEGEITFYNILLEYMKEKNYKDIDNISWLNKTNNQIIKTNQSYKNSNLEDLPSPYTSGVFNNIIKNKKIQWMALWETNRGCPYSCKFCYWGKINYKKLRKFPLLRIRKEIEWFSNNEISIVFGCDSNFGIMKRDLDIASYLANSKQKTGFPKTFRVCFAKNSGDTVFEIERILHKSKMSKGVSLSMQSLDSKVLENIGRKNIEIKNFNKIQSSYAREDMVTYSELIIGLPGETYNSFTKGISLLLNNGQHSGMNIYNCSIIPNSEMSEQSYQNKYGIKTINIPIFQAHSDKQDEVMEYESIIISTDTLSITDWKKTYQFSWAIQCFHFLGMLQPISIFMNKMFNMSYEIFYKEFIEYGNQHKETCLYKEIKILNRILNDVLKGKSFDQYLPEFLDINWPPEEATFLRLSSDINLFYNQVNDFMEKLIIKYNIIIPHKMYENLITYQKATLVKCDYKENSRIELDYNIHEYIMNCKIGENVNLKKNKFLYEIDMRSSNYTNISKFAREIVWYGRKGGKFLYKIVSVGENE